MPILDQIAQKLEKVSMIVETLIKMFKSVWKEACDSTKEGNIKIIMEKT